MASDAAAAKVISNHQEQGWSLLCNGTVLFDDGGLLRPDRASVGTQKLLRPRHYSVVADSGCSSLGAPA